MLQFKRVSRKSILEGWTPGLLLGVLFYIAGILFLYFAGSSLGQSLTPCLLLQVTGIECPLCGGTTASLFLLTGDLLGALSMNPLVALALAFGMIWIALWLAFGIRIRFLGGDRTFVLVLLALLVLNWAYVLFAH
jgi:hypothetical protein